MSKRNIPINIQGQPPTQAELDRAKKRLLLRIVVAVIVCISVLISSGTIVYLVPTFYAFFVALIVAPIPGILSMKIAQRGYRYLGLFDPLDPEKHPEECLEYSKFLSDPAVAAYHAQILAQGRGLVIMEYRAARAWISAAPEREKQAQAKEVYAKICSNIVV
ncbi:hypothetical protein Selin_1447 [Desulfurispirillum indicum S5]|uniref:Uncharacterized protein n=1 Tax=Desulfurispirillum indicum (strain ATCC BAA-1389 / DSM 22839 / S5) TaxID=653733 RepID=E6W6T8_DESIS|nr:hypothetical protein [Desulfurispirillum indicum]ADU66181.1 hypothetical protein Selin_1447 [Desulfurispirillum indicum S5]